MPDQKNLILAIALSILILLGFQFFLAPPQAPEPETTAQSEVAPDGASPGLEGMPPAAMQAEGPGATQTRTDALAQAPRVRIDTPRLHGSLSLVGGRIDDLTLADYHLTTDPSSPEIVLLSPRTAPEPYYADFGWLAAEGVPVPGPDTEWTTDAEVLTPDNPVTLTWDNGEGLRFERTIAVDNSYMFTISQTVTNTTDAPVTLSPYGRILRFGEPDTLGFFILHEGPYGVFDGTLDEYSYDSLRDDGAIIKDTTGGWLGFTDKYWMASLVPDQQVGVEAQFIHRFEGQQDRFYALYRAEPVTVAPGDTVEATNRLFAGAKEVPLIDRYAEQYNITNFDRSVDFGWFYFLTKPFFYALYYINGVVGNFGVSILIFTVFIKLLFFPLANKSYKAMSKMKALQPEMMKLRERYADDRQRMNMELMNLYKSQKVNPASGCLPILIQIPVFFALYKVLFVSIEMRHAPFFGWIQDLSAPDPTSIFNLFGLIPWTPPEFLMIGVWPLIMGVTMYLQQKLNPAPADPIQQKIFMALPIVFTFLLARFPAGLVIYWAWNNALSILQQWVIMRRMGVKAGGGVDKPELPPPSPGRKKAKEPAAAQPAAATATAAEGGSEAGPAPATTGQATTSQAPAKPAAKQQRAKQQRAKQPGQQQPTAPAAAGSAKQARKRRAASTTARRRS